VRRAEFLRRARRAPTPAERREMRRRLGRLHRAVERWMLSLPRDGSCGEISRSLPADVRRVVRAHDACDWFAVAEDLASEDGS
jgi:hypothetical protein